MIRTDRSRRGRIAGLLALYLCSVAAEARAQDRFDHYTTSNGLPQNTVSSITQTRDGYLWFGTYDGLVRYDGVRFSIFDKSNTPAFGSNQILTLCEDAQGTLWIGTGEAGLIRYRDGVFTSYGTAQGLPDDLVNRIEDSPQGLLVFMRGVPHRWAGEKATPLDPAILDEFVDRDGATWTRFSDRVVRRRGAEQSFAVTVTREEFRQRYQDATGAMWFRTQKNGVYRIAGAAMEHYDAADGLPAAEWSRGAGTDRDGTVWIAGITAVARFKDGRLTGQSSHELLGSNHVRALFIDREGAVWIGTNENGLFRATRRILTSYGVEQGILGKAVYPIFETRDGTLWFGSGNGLTRLAKGTFRRNLIVAEGGDRSRLRFGVPGDGGEPLGIRSFWQDRDGRMWLGVNRGLIVIEHDRITDRSALVEHVGVDAILQDRRGRMWIGTHRGIVRIDGSDVTFFPEQDFLPGASPGVLYEDRQGRIWVGTRGGVARFENNRFVAITTKDGLAGDRIRSFYEDADGVVWIGTFDSGLSRLENGRITNFTTANGLFNNGVFQILEDARGYFWMSCNRGIYRVSRRQLNDVARGAAVRVSSVAYGSQDGMLSSEANGGRQPAGIKARDGRLWFPTQNGVVSIDPAAEASNSEPPPVVIESVSVDGVAVPFAGGIHLEPGQRDLEITYTAPSSIKAEHIQFKYLLDGLGSRWVDAGTRRTVHYSYLPPGSYTFRLAAANSDGVWNENGMALAIRIQPYFYQTRWFAALVIFLIAAGGGAAYSTRMRRVRTREDHLKGLVAQRTAELQSAHDKLHQLATLDGLTNIANHRRFKEFLGQEWQRTQRTRTPLSLLMLDVDFFKFYNDTYGHQAGDECLKRVAFTLAETVQRGTDLAARYGGEEFAIVLTDTGTEGAVVVAETIRARVEAMQIPHSASKVHKYVTVSIGVATRVGDPDVGPDALIAAADAALYKAKHMGRNRCVSESEEHSVNY